MKDTARSRPPTISRRSSPSRLGAIRPGGEPLARGGEQGRVVVDQPPALPPRQVRGDGAQVRAGAAAEIDDRDALAAGEDRSELGEKAGIARAVVGRLAQRQPIRR